MTIEVETGLAVGWAVAFVIGVIVGLVIGPLKRRVDGVLQRRYTDWTAED